jgi:hypothetical protein
MSSFLVTIFATESHPGRLRGLPETKNCSVASSENDRIDTLVIYTSRDIPSQGISKTLTLLPPLDSMIGS